MIAVPATREEITKEWFQQVLDSTNMDVSVEEIQVEDGTKVGENFAALVLRAKVVGKKAGEPWTQSFILKIMPEADWAKNIMADKKVFHKEVEAYNEVIPYMINASQNKLIPDVPRCYFGKTDQENNGVIVLEDLKPLGYGLADVKKGQDVEHCKLLLRSLAKFHAIGYKAKFTAETPITKRFESLGDYMFEKIKAEWKPPLMKSLENLEYLLIDCDQKEKIKLRFENSFENVFDQATTRDNPEEDFFFTICHGDAWSNNMLFKYGEDGKPVSLTMIDLQVVYYGLPFRDIGYFFCMSTSGEVRKEHLKELLEFYRLELLNFLEILGVTQITAKELSFDKLWEMYYKTIPVGFLQAVNGVPVLMMPSNMLMKTEEMQGKSVEEMAAIFSRKTQQFILKDKETRDRLCYLIEEAIHNNVI